MGFILQLSILSLAVLVVSGVRPKIKYCHWDEFQCPNQECIPKTCLCDGNNDCGDYTDEQQHCGCRADEFPCPNEERCLPKIAECDGVYDCGDGADEKDCPIKKVCKDISSHCAHNAHQCNTSYHVKENCQKTCNLCPDLLVCPVDNRPDGVCTQPVPTQTVPSYSQSASASLPIEPIELFCNNDRECTDRHSPNHKCCPDKCFGGLRTCKPGE